MAGGAAPHRGRAAVILAPPQTRIATIAPAPVRGSAATHPSLPSPATMSRLSLRVVSAAVLSAAASAQCVPPSQLQSTPGLRTGTVLSSTSLDPGPADYFDVAVDAGLVLTRLGIVY